MKNDRTGSGKAMETLPGPKTAIKNLKIPKLGENSKIGIFVFSRGRASYFPGGGLPIFPGRRPGRSPIYDYLVNVLGYVCPEVWNKVNANKY